jgi:esterase/lipase superfamily enzyme
MTERYYRWYTPHLSREMDMLVFGQGTGRGMILFPTSLGRFYQNKDFGLIESMRHWIDSGLLTVYCPDGIDERSWYNKSIHPHHRVQTHLAYERYILQEVVPKVQNDTWREKVIFAGCSFGGFHAANTAFKYPHLTHTIISCSGAFDANRFLNGYSDPVCYFNNPMTFLGGMHDHGQLEAIRRMGIIIETAEEDGLKEENFRFHQLLNQKGIPHWFDFRRWATHDWGTWCDAFPYYLSKIYL